MKVEDTISSAALADANNETVAKNGETRQTATLELPGSNTVEGTEPGKKQHPFAALLGTFSGATWDEIRQEFAQEYQKASLSRVQLKV